MRTFITSILILFCCGLSAQQMHIATFETSKSPQFYWEQGGAAPQSPAPEVDLGLRDPLKTGKALLITAGCMTAAGAALYGSAWAMIGDSSSVGAVFSISGIALVGASVPLYIAGAVLYVKGKRTTLSMTGTSVTLRF